MPANYDTCIVGGGPVGVTLALALKDSERRILLLEARAAPIADTRVLALSYGSRLIFERLGVWSRLTAATPIRAIHVSERGRFGRAELSAADVRLPALGYVVEYAVLQRALHDALAVSGVRRLTDSEVTRIDLGSEFATFAFGERGQATAKLAAIADGGGGSFTDRDMKIRDYRQSAVVAPVKAAEPHRDIAYERFCPKGAIALLPHRDRFALVWTTTPETAAELCALDEAGFLGRLHAQFGDRLGDFTEVGNRAAFALRLRYAKHVTAPRQVLLGNAAQALHPVAAQGLNLGLRDAWELAAHVDGAADPGAQSVLDAYRRRRAGDRNAAIFFTDALVRLCSSDMLGAGRGAALAILESLPMAKRSFVRRMIFGATN